MSVPQGRVAAAGEGTVMHVEVFVAVLERASMQC